MVLTKEELIQLLQKEVRILQHLIGKIEPRILDYRPTPKQRSTLELLRYLSFMGPAILPGIKEGTFDMSGWTACEEKACTLDFAAVQTEIAALSQKYAQLVSEFSDEDFRGQVEMFGDKANRGSIIVSLVVNGHAAYRTQLFLYLKANGREELNTFNLWAGIDGQM